MRADYDPLIEVKAVKKGQKLGKAGAKAQKAVAAAKKAAADAKKKGASRKKKKKVASRKGKEKAEDDSEDRVIMHCDFDSFFVSAGLIDRPHLRGKPVVVCHSQGNQGGLASTSEIASASYEAREFGIKGGMRFVEYSQYVEYF